MQKTTLTYKTVRLTQRTAQKTVNQRASRTSAADVTQWIGIKTVTQVRNVGCMETGLERRTPAVLQALLIIASPGTVEVKIYIGHDLKFAFA